MIRAVIIDDEEACRSLLIQYLETFCSNVTVVGQANSALTGLQIVRNEKPDVVFLDVEMPDYSGFEFLSFFDAFDFQVIFTTAHANYALQAFEVSAIGYLLKPINVKSLLKITDELERKIYLENIEDRITTLKVNMESDGQITRISLPVSNGYRFVNLTDILYLKADGSYTQFHLVKSETILIAKKLKTFDYLANNSGFYRTHRSYLISLQHAVQYVKQDGGYILMSNDDIVSISRDRKDDFLKVIRLVS
jgi:two-component system LytT family response regulator